MQVDYENIRKALLEIVSKYSGTSSLQPVVVFREAWQALGIRESNVEIEQAMLTIWGDLFRNGLIAWGYNLSNPDPPFCHVTELGRATLRNLSRDPSNPDGYTKHLATLCSLNPISESYLLEALRTYNSNCAKASAVMIGAAAESIVLEVREEMKATMSRLGQRTPSGLDDWRIKVVFDALTNALEARKSQMGNHLRESYEAFWSSFAGQLRMTRNDAGHPASIDPVTRETAQSSLLIFPSFAKLAYDLKSWIHSDLVAT
jgi:hypothetical protein